MNIAHHQFRLKPEHMEHPTGVSMTVPDETLTIRQILEKHVRGMKIAEELYKQPMYDSGADFDSEDLESVSRIDLFERELMAERQKENVKVLKDKLKASSVKAKGSSARSTEQPEDVSDDGASGPGTGVKGVGIGTDGTGVENPSPKRVPVPVAPSSRDGSS